MQPHESSDRGAGDGTWTARVRAMTLFADRSTSDLVAAHARRVRRVVPTLTTEIIDAVCERVPQFDWARGAAASIIVDKHGKRFANESLPYNDFPKAFAQFDGTALEFPHLGAPGWMVFDQSEPRPVEKSRAMRTTEMA